ncbi:hypothetical protein RH831_10935 [Halodesulfurarchaeum sp. HSR-GB]|uniref:hypothetical protein n=1 Tax=Halodesulfurarchaeum sp. HSR-GB TaxID=3074077 RepID=UPI0028579C85|nr:hypothetical protein [Halodesulfurarchaeum sp. HSR-GB]MDR5657690.1 hypothetical protein [Halodesulfurarchaeum sp. HSR-GB]
MHQPGSIPELPQLESGVQLLETPDRAVGPLQTLVLDHLLLDGGTAVWIDALEYGTSVYLAEVAPSQRILDRIKIARGQTAYRHFSLVQSAVEQLTEDTNLIVAPAIDGLYRNDDVRGLEPKELMLRSLSRLAQYAREANTPVLTTRTRADGFSAPIESLATNTIEVHQTEFGARFESDDFETLVYTNGQTMQTTLAYWKRILKARQPIYGREGVQQTTTTVKS